MLDCWRIIFRKTNGYHGQYAINIDNKTITIFNKEDFSQDRILDTLLEACLGDINFTQDGNKEVQFKKDLISLFLGRSEL